MLVLQHVLTVTSHRYLGITQMVLHMHALHTIFPYRGSLKSAELLQYYMMCFLDLVPGQGVLDSISEIDEDVIPLFAMLMVGLQGL